MLSASNQKNAIHILSVSKKFSTGYENLYQWGRSGSSISTFTLDILKAQDMAKTEDIFYHLERPNRKLSFILQKDMIYVVGADLEIQSQLLEAVLEEAIKKFSDFYKKKLNSYVGGFVSEFKDFDSELESIINKINNLVKVVIVPCAACKKTTSVIVKKSIFDKPHKSFPIPLVYCHKGHAVLIYLDRQYNVRGNEIVDINME